MYADRQKRPLYRQAWHTHHSLQYGQCITSIMPLIEGYKRAEKSNTILLRAATVNRSIEMKLMV